MILGRFEQMVEARVLVWDRGLSPENYEDRVENVWKYAVRVEGRPRDVLCRADGTEPLG